MSTQLSAPAAPPAAQTSRSFRQILVRYSLVAYFVIAFAGSWLIVLPLILSKGHLGVLSVSLPMTPFIVVAPFFGPTLGAFLLTGLSSGRPGIRALLRRYVLWRVGLRWYAVMLCGSFVVLLLGATMFFGLVPLDNFVRQWPKVLVTYGAGLVFSALLGGPIGEEGGWRGFALPRMQKRLGPVAASLVLGFLWGAWHLVGFFGGWLGAFSVAALAGLVLSAMAFSVVATWVFNNTRGSIFIAILMHSAGNAAAGVGGLLLPQSMPSWLHLFVYSSGIGVLAYGVWAVVLVILTRGRLSYRPSAPSPAQPL
jgi:membrane protease YdiL (CAAX protease family)